VLSAEEDVPLGTVKGSNEAVESSKLVVELIKMKNYIYLILTREQKKCMQLSCSFELLRAEMKVSTAAT
jgi:hypothetical protein